MPGSRSALSLVERKQRAFELFTRGRTVQDVADELDVHPDTAGRYRDEFETQVLDQARANPRLLQQVLENTLLMLEENEQVRKEAWRHFERAVTDQARSQYLSQINKAQETRAKLLGVLGVKQEYMARVESVHALQQRLIEFMRKELCTADRQKLERLLLTVDQEPEQIAG